MLRHGQGPLSAASFRLAISFETSMSALGQKQTCAVQKGTSALPPKATFIATLIRKAPRIAALHPNSATALAACIGATGHRA